MLRYTNRGMRDYGQDAVPVYSRGNWEFQAVVSGTCAPMFRTLRTEFSERTLWVFAPDNAHGWAGPAGEPCERIVFHFDEVPEAIEELIPPRSMASVHLTEAQTREVIEIHSRCWNAFARPGARNEIVTLHGLVSLCMILTENLDLKSQIVYENRNKSTVMSALAWFEQNMSKGPTMRELARTVHTSESQLRRLFRSVLHVPPHKMLLDRKMSRAKFLLSATSMSVSEIAFATGYRSLSSFSRAFTAASGDAPAAWRTRNNEIAKHFV